MSADDAPVGSLPGIGPVTQRWLAELGILRAGDLRALGSVEAYRRLKFLEPRRVSVNALYALEAALRGCRWLDLPSEAKEDLRRQAETIHAALREGMAARRRLR